ncbi:MAG: hypothetical protein GY828_06855 [Candidatus Gracilibacteria bacterium]|nr:hypothetical protein [Candidatus Gracilibacteria bacterium]
MKIIPILLLTFGTIIIVFPDIIAYLLGGLFIFLGLNGLLLGGLFQKFNKKSGKKGHGDDYVQFGKYKIFK